MSELPKDGGPENPSAFPVSTIDGFTAHGMDLRDYFAALSLGALISKHPLITSDDGETVELAIIRKGMAQSAYRYADAMLLEREARSK